MENFIAEYGLFTIAFFLFIDDLGIPFPTSTIVFSAAVLARATGEIPLVTLFLMSIFIPPISNGILFFWGRHGARRWLQTHGHKFLLPNSRLKKADVFFEKYGEKTIFFGSIFTTVRAVLAIIAGSANMHPFKFVIFNVLGIFVWASAVVGTGYIFGENVWQVVKNNWEITLGIVLLIIAAKIYFFPLFNNNNNAVKK